MPVIKIADREIGQGNPVFVVAELSANHLQKFDVAIELVKAAGKNGADAVKVQTYTPDMMTIDCTNESFRIKHGTVWDGKTLYQLYKEAYMPLEWHMELKKLAESIGLMFFSTAYDKQGVDFLEQLGVPAYKIASFEITDTPFIEYVASKKKPVMISTGIAEQEEIEEAVNTCRKVNNSQIILLKCTSSYPADIDQMNLRLIPDLQRKFGVLTGLSDHTLDIHIASVSVALGACVIEKHFTLDRSCGGPDTGFSLEPDEFRQMVTGIRNTEKALGRATYKLSEKAKLSRKFARSLFVVKEVKAGEIFTEQNVRSIRPSDGLGPENIGEIIGKKAKVDILRGTPLRRDMIL
jgi:pseudaminic acid synthase